MVVDYIGTHNKCPEESMNILQVLRFTKASWCRINAQSISNCFKHDLFEASSSAEVFLGDLSELLTSISAHITETVCYLSFIWFTGQICNLIILTEVSSLHIQKIEYDS